MSKSRKAKLYPAFHTNLPYSRNVKQRVEKLIEDAKCPDELDVFYVIASICLNFAVESLRISREFPKVKDAKKLLDLRSGLLDNMCVIQECLKRLQDVPEILDRWPKIPNSHCFQCYESSTLLAIGAFCGELQLYFTGWLFKVTPFFDSSKDTSFPEVIPPSKWDDIDVNIEFRRVLANLRYETEQTKTKRKVSLVPDLVKALKQADELLELWDIGNKDSDAFDNGWNSPDGRCCPKKSLEKAASYLKQMGDNDAAKHIEAETKTLSERAVEFDYSYDEEPIPPVKKDVFDPLRNYLLVLIQKFEASDKTHLGSAKIKADNWEQVTIEVVDDDTIKYKVNDKKWERANYTELGFLDRRKHLPNNLWPKFLSLAERIRPMPNPPNIKPKDIDRIRSTLRNFFCLQKIPIQYDSKNQKYSCMFKFYDNRDW